MPLSLKPWLEQVSIQKKDLTVEPLKLDEPFAWAQAALAAEVERQYNLGLPVRIIVLKGRQVGISTASEAILFNWTFLHPGTQSLVIAHDTKASQHLFGMAKLMWEEWPFRSAFHEKHNSQKSLGWLETRSAMSVSTAKNAGSGRSFTYHAVHCSEVGFWEDPERLMVGLNQSIPYKHGTIVIYESTANGVGNWFHEEWLRAVHKQSNFVPLFFPWYEHNEYEIPTTTLRDQDLMTDEVELKETLGLGLPKLAWRRHAIANLCMGDENQFHQEYPCTPDEAFLSTGTHIFPLHKLEECYEPKAGQTGFLHDDNGTIKFTPDPSGPLTIYTWPSSDRDWGKYVVAGDPTRTTYGDYSCIQVFNRRTFEQVAVWHGHIDPVSFGHEIIRLGYYYNTALVNTEINGPGYATIAILMQMGYPDVWRHRWADKAPGKLSQSYGWASSWNRKNEAIGIVIDLIAQNALLVHHDITYDEMRNFVHLAGWEVGPASERGNDDTVLALLIALMSTITESPLPYGKPASEGQVNDLWDRPPWDAMG
jgi:hypothetical protein